MIKTDKRGRKRRDSIASVKHKAWYQFSRFIRLRDCYLTTGSLEFGECISCGTNKEFKQLDAGHFVPKHYGNYFSEHGVHAQCRKDNRFLSGSQLAYRKSLIELYGEAEVDRLELENKTEFGQKFSVQGLYEILEKYKTKTDKMVKLIESGKKLTWQEIDKL